MKQNTTVISLGGSLICPKVVDIKFLKSIVSLIKNNQRINKRNRIIIITGGGFICRQYTAAFDAVNSKNKKKVATTLAKDYIGIAMTKVNATLLQQLLVSAGVKTNQQLIVDPRQKINWKKNNVAIGAGFLPGHSTDYIAALAAVANKATRVINLTNIDSVYTKDPRKFKNAKPLKNLTWNEYKKVLKVSKWKAGLHTPFDPLASKLAQQKKLTVIIVNGQKKKSLSSILSNKPVGTIIYS